MDNGQAKATVLGFNDCINARDIERLPQMMTDDHVFIDASGNSVSGKPACVGAWQRFFAAFPDYPNDFAQIYANEELLVIVGCSSCSDPRLDGPALWTAKVRGHRVSEWRVIEDTVVNRNKLGVAQ
ncbi:MAG: nuclear transport factor 2 family protein [Rhodoplanes sp.]